MVQPVWTTAVGFDDFATHHPRTAFLVRRVRREATAVADRSAVDSTAWQPPYAFFATPEAAIGKHCNFEAIRHLLNSIAKHIMLVLERHLLRAAWQRLLWFNHRLTSSHPRFWSAARSPKPGGSVGTRGTPHDKTNTCGFLPL